MWSSLLEVTTLPSHVHLDSTRKYRVGGVKCSKGIKLILHCFCHTPHAMLLCCNGVGINSDGLDHSLYSCHNRRGIGSAVFFGWDFQDPKYV